MKNFLIAAFLTIASMVPAAAADRQPQHLLDGTSVNFYYTNGRAIHMEFYAGQLKYKWIAGPSEGKGNQDLAYQSRKVGDGIYMVNWLEAAHPDFLTLLFNFKTNVMYSSGILRFSTKDQRVVFDGGILQDVTMVTKE